jgi:hypothetical protein
MINLCEDALVASDLHFLFLLFDFLNHVLRTFQFLTVHRSLLLARMLCLLDQDQALVYLSLLERGLLC